MVTYDEVPSNHWARYEPSVDAPWNLRRVVHLHRRAGFAAARSEIDRDLADGPDASVSRLLSGTGPAARSTRARGVRDESRRSWPMPPSLRAIPAVSRLGGSIGCSSRPIRWASGSRSCGTTTSLRATRKSTTPRP